MRFCRHAALLILLPVLFAPSIVRSQLVNGRFVTSIYAWEQFDTVNVSKSYLRGLQSFIVDVTQSAFSLHTHVQAAATLRKELEEEPDYRLYYLYGQVRGIGNAVDVSFGRLPFYAGVGNGTVDGLRLVARVASDYKFTVYGGANTPFDLTFRNYKPLARNFTVGGQFLVTRVEHLRLGVSYINRSREVDPYWAIRPDSLFNPLSVYIVPENRKEQLAGADASYQFSATRVYGRFDYDLNVQESHRAQLSVQTTVSENVALSAEYFMRRPTIPYNSFFSVFPAEAVNEFEGGADLLLWPCLRGFVRGGYVKYTDDDSFRYTVGVAHNNVSVSYQGTSGYAGELGLLTLQGAYGFADNRIVPSAALTYYSYKTGDSDAKQNAVAASLGATVRPFQVLSIDLQGQWLHNKIVDSDVRFFGKLNYWFSERLSIF